VPSSARARDRTRRAPGGGAPIEAPREAGPDVHVLTSNLVLPGIGVLPVNALVLRAEEPVLVDSGLGVDSAELVDAVASIVDLTAPRWVWLTHDGADHTGRIARVLELAPQARLVTHGIGALRLSTWARIPLERVHAIRPGDRLPAGDARCAPYRHPSSTTRCRSASSTRAPGRSSAWTRSVR